ncbi:MAG: hypothetical protein AAGB51_03205 [Planctomycetota bacterium]
MNGMEQTIVRLLGGADGLDLSDPSVRLAFEREWPAWAWALIVVGAVLVAWLGYRRIDATRPPRFGLAILRAAFIVLVMLVIAGPRLVRDNESVEPDWLVVLADRSASLSIPDAPGGTARDTQLREAIEAASPTLAEPGENRRVLVMGFGAGAFELETDESGRPEELGPADARRTAIGEALTGALDRLAARPIAGVLLLSDGRSADAIPRAARRRLDRDLIPVISVPLGSPDPVRDLAVARAEAPPVAFIDDVVPVLVRIDAIGEGAGGAVELVDRDTGLVLDRQRIEPGDQARTEVSLTARRSDAGTARWAVRLVPDGPDVVDTNNSTELDVSFVDEPLRVGYFDGYPRWEHRYLRNLLLREASIDSSTLLLATDRTYTQEGDTPLAVLPDSPEAWAEYDVIVLGDLRAESFTPEQLEQMREAVSDRGVGLLWVAGEGATPRTWRGTPMADLLPFTASEGQSAPPRWTEPITVSPAPAADRYGLMQLAPPDSGQTWLDELSDPATGWPLMYWAQRLDAADLKPTAEVIATATPISDGVAPGTRASPLVISMRYGAGRVAYVATDEIWRWRYGRGETLYERFWTPLMRHLGRESLARGAAGAELTISPDPAVAGRPARIELRVFDQSIIDTAPEAVELRIVPEDAAAGAQQETLRLTGDGEGTFTANWVPGDPGSFAFAADAASLGGLDLRAAAQVTLPDDELRRPETDHPFLMELSEQSGGVVLSVAELPDLSSYLPNRSVVISAPPDVRTLWDRPAVFTLLLLLPVLEWMGRRLIRLS